jgi:hypothetical protein
MANRTLSDLFLILVYAPLRGWHQEFQRAFGWCRFILALALASRSAR